MSPVPRTATAGLIVLLSAVPVLAGCVPSAAGAGPQLAPVRVTVPAGHTAQQEVTVGNPTSGTETLTVAWARVADPGRRPVPKSWVQPASITLGGGTTGTVTLKVNVPAGAHGRYHGYIIASAAGQGQAPLGGGGLVALIVKVTS